MYIKNAPTLVEKEKFFKKIFDANDRNITIIKLDDIKNSFRKKFFTELKEDDFAVFFGYHKDIREKVKRKKNGDFELEHREYRIEEFKNKIYSHFNITSSSEFRIISVEIVEGFTLNATWKSPMQIITTDKGCFIDNVPNRQFGCYTVASSGYDWSKLIGKTTNNVKIIKSRGFEWINYQDKSKV